MEQRIYEQMNINVVNFPPQIKDANGGLKPSNMGLFEQEKAIRSSENADDYKAEMPTIFNYYMNKSKEKVIDKIT